jgi:hypothetical protein
MELKRNLPKEYLPVKAPTTFTKYNRVLNVLQMVEALQKKEINHWKASYQSLGCADI